MSRAADVSIGLYWQDRAKRWAVVIHATGGTCTLPIESTTSISGDDVWRLAEALRAEIESWLPF